MAASQGRVCFIYHMKMVHTLPYVRNTYTNYLTNQIFNAGILCQQYFKNAAGNQKRI